MSDSTALVNTVLGPVPATELGYTSIHESLLSVVPGAEYAPDITIDRAEIYEILHAELSAYRTAGGRSIVDASGMFHGRNLPLLENLARNTGVHIIATTGMGPEEMLGGYFLTPQTNPPTPWPAEKFASLFAREVTEGMVIPRHERRGPAGMIVTLASPEGMTATDESLLRGGARAARDTGAALSHRFGADLLAEIDIALSEGLAPTRLVVRGAERREAPVFEAARRGVFLSFEGTDSADLITELIDAGHRGQILLSAGAVGVAKGHEAPALKFSSVLTDLLPALPAEHITQITEINPRALLALA